MPQQYERPTTTGVGDGYGQATITGPSNPYNTSVGQVSRQCMMFMPYVPPVFLEAVCSLHMTPLAAGVVQSIPTSCLAPTGGQNARPYSNQPTTTTYPGSKNTYTQQGNTFTQDTNTYEQEGPTTTNDGYGQPTTTATYGVTTTGAYDD
ncbi:MAG: hypothetical protein Q9166_003381 [cf. Caloplaca sp. 2 TL-2023]